MPAKIKKGDFVMIISGKNKRQTGKVLQVLPKKGQCIVEKVNVVKRHQKANRAGTPSGIIDKNKPVPLSIVMLVDSKTKKPSRVRMAKTDKGTVRQFAKSGEAVESAA